MAVRPDDRFDSAIDFGRSLQRVELELSFAPTTLDVPNLAQARPQATPGDEDATRVRPMVTVMPSAPAAPPKDADATVIRSGVPSVAAQTPEPDATRIRPRPITPKANPQPDSSSTVRTGPKTVDASGSRTPRPRRSARGDASSAASWARRRCS